MSIPAVINVAAVGQGIAPPALGVTQAPGVDFGRMLMDGIGKTSEKLNAADRQLAAFALDDTIPVHQVTFALEQARLSIELMLQVRSQIMQAYQQMMAMQL